MFSCKLRYCALFLVALVCGCASAEKRFDQGFQLEMQGQYEAAVARYAQALEKSPSLETARIRLIEVGDLAIAERLEDAEYASSQNDPVGSASHYQRIDRVVARARSVGVRLALPDDFGSSRRFVFDDAFDALVARGVVAREQGRWQDGLNACRQARRDFEPSMEQRNRALTEEATLLVQWSEVEYHQGRLRSAFEIAANVGELEWCPTDQSVQADALMQDAILEGEVELIVLPVQAKSGSKREASRTKGLAAQIETKLWQGPWHNPPAFVLIEESLAVRALMSRAGILDNAYKAATMALILRLAEADYAAHLQLLDIESIEFDVRSRTQITKTRSGKSTTFLREDGKRRFQAKARVIIADGFGNEIENVIVTATGTAAVARGGYDGDPRQLNLDSRQVDLFDDYALKEQERAARDALVLDMTASIAGAVFEATLAQVP